jgi:hypothetical protein
VAVLQQLIAQDEPMVSSTRTKPSSGAIMASARIHATAQLTDFAELLRIWIKLVLIPKAECSLDCAVMSYATGRGGGRCCRAWSERRPGAVDWTLRAMLTSSMGGDRGRLEGCTKPLGLMLPNVSPQLLPQDRLENDGPAGGFACALQQ